MSDITPDPSDMPAFNACDLDQHASELIRKGDFEGARKALIARDVLREQGDASTEPTPPPPRTAESYEEVAAEFEAKAERIVAAAEHSVELAERARAMAAAKRKEDEETGGNA